MKNTLNKLVITLCATVFLVSNNAFSSEKLKFIGDQNISTGEKFKETEIGGLSGLTYDREKNKILAVSDDRSSVNDARFYEFDLKLNEKTFKVTPTEVVTLKDKEGKPFKKMAVDFEGITLFNGNLIISSEGWINHEPPFDPELFVFNRDGTYKKNLEIPEKFLSNKGQENKMGVRDNLAFEGLTSTPDGKIIWVGTEGALNQDDKVSTPNNTSMLRLILYKEFKPIKEVAYLLEKVPAIKIAGLTVGESGLSDMLAIDENNFYTIERSYLPLAKKTIIRVFKNSINEKTTDISNFPSLKGKEKEIKMVDKEMIADLEEFKDQMSTDFQNLDNIEGITFGPKLENGHNTIIFVSDNNFSKKQRTQFLAFEIIP